MTKRIYDYGLEELKACGNLSHLAFLLGVEPKFLSRQIYKTDDQLKYHSFEIAKKNGTKRTINAPNKNLKFIQSRLSRLLYQCYFDIHGKPDFPARATSHGFQKNRDLSIYTNAVRHIGRKYVLNADIENFFPTFNFGRVRGYFIKNKHFTLSETVATVIAQTACFQNALPQGAPSSPIISEFITQALDYKLQSLAKKYRCTYSRYADDITFSTNLSEFPSHIGFLSPDTENWSVGKSFEKSVLSSGFKLNATKIRMQQQNQRQATTNLTVNRKVNIGSYYYKGVRFAAYSMMKNGKAIATGKLSLTAKELNSHQIWGMLCHVHDIKGRGLHHTALRNYTNAHPAPHYLRLMKDFFHYLRIHTSAKPIVICEGKTDYIYLKEAIRWNVANQRIGKLLVKSGKLSDLKNTKGDHWLVDFVNHSDMAGDLLDLAGGGGDLPKFMTYHLDRFDKLHSDAPPKPVIIIVDNDSQSDGMWSTIKRITGSKAAVDGTKPYYHVGKNLYVVPIPAGGAKDFYIEKLFPDHWLKEKLGGKSLKIIQKKGEKLTADHYGKTDFANKVIKANRGKVDCSAFLPLLLTLCDIIESK